jgi:uncharacterized protein YraI
MQQSKSLFRRRRQVSVLGITLSFIALFVLTASVVTAAPSVNVPQVAQTCTPTAITTASVNLRSGPGTNYSVIAVIPPATQLPVTGRTSDNAWYQVIFNGLQGWASASYLVTSCMSNVPVISNPAPPPTAAPAPTPTPSNGISMTANPTTVNLGQCSMLNWKVPGLVTVYLGYGAMQSRVPTVGSQSVCPVMSTRFYIRVDDAGVSSFYPVDITVINPYNPANFRANAYIVKTGQCPTLYWNIENVNGVYLYQNSTTAQGVAGNSSVMTCVSQPTNFALRVVNNDGSETITPLTINILDQPAGNVVFIANPTSISPGQCTQLQWLAGNAKTVYLLDSSTGTKTTVGSLGNIQVCPPATTTYTVQAVLINGITAQQSQTITVGALSPTPIP